MPKGYHHLTYAQRSQIVILKASGFSISEIAKSLCVNQSTISREFKRNKEQDGYRYDRAQEKYHKRRNTQPNKKMTPALITKIRENLLVHNGSPVQISGWLKDDEGILISHETIYKYIWSDKEHGGFLYTKLRKHGKKYNKRSKGTAGRGCIPGRVDIDQRPAIVEKKIRLGDWELDTIVGKRNSGVIVSMVDRASKFTKLVKLKYNTAEDVGEALINALRPFIGCIHTLTSDNGKEFANHKKVSAALMADFYFAKPYHPWERGLNEHTNGLVRQYFPKGTSFKDVTQADVEKVEWILNNRPRKILGFKKPQQILDKLLKAYIEESASKHLAC